MPGLMHRWFLMCTLFCISDGREDATARSLVCQSSSHGLNVSWQPVQDARRYILRLGIEGIEHQVGGHETDGNETHFLMGNLVAGKRYWFQLLALVGTTGNQVNASWVVAAAKTECSSPAKLQESALPSVNQACWSKRIDGDYVLEQQGATNECYSFDVARQHCEAAMDCFAVATQSNICGGLYRVTYGGPTLKPYADWKTLKLGSYKLDRACIRAAAPRRRYLAPRRRGYFVLDVIRHNHGGIVHDGLDNKNAADAVAQASLFKLGFHMDSCMMSLYHVHVKKDVAKTKQVTTYGQGHGYYGNYMSCNPDANSPGGYGCLPIIDADCPAVFQGPCPAEARDISFSKDHVGLAMVQRGTLGPNGAKAWSFPHAGSLNKHWRRDKEFLVAPCHQGMTEADIQKAFAKSASAYAAAWNSDVSAFAAANQSSSQLIV